MRILKQPVKLNLVGLDGNAFALLGNFRSAGRSQGIPKQQLDEVIELAQSGDYNHLLNVLIANTEDEE